MGNLKHVIDSRGGFDRAKLKSLIDCFIKTKQAYNISSQAKFKKSKKKDISNLVFNIPGLAKY